MAQAYPLEVERARPPGRRSPVRYRPGARPLPPGRRRPGRKAPYRPIRTPNVPGTVVVPSKSSWNKMNVLKFVHGWVVREIMDSAIFASSVITEGQPEIVVPAGWTPFPTCGRSGDVLGGYNGSIYCGPLTLAGVDLGGSNYRLSSGVDRWQYLYYRPPTPEDPAWRYGQGWYRNRYPPHGDNLTPEQRPHVETPTEVVPHVWPGALNLPKPLPYPFGWFPEHLPVGLPDVGIAPAPWQDIPKAPEQSPWGEPVRGPQALPAPWEPVMPGPVQVTPGASPKPLPGAFPRPPGKFTKEKKAAWKSGPLVDLIKQGLNGVTEGLDALMCVQKGLPAKYRAKPVWVDGKRPPGNPFQRPRERGKEGWKWTPHGWQKADGYYRAPRPDEVAWAIYQHADKLDVGKVVACLASNHVEDMVIGWFGKQSAAASRNRPTPGIGWQAGAAL